MERRTKGGDFQAKKHAECQDRGDGGEIRRDRVVLVIAKGASEELKSSKRQKVDFWRATFSRLVGPACLCPHVRLIVSFRAAPFINFTARPPSLYVLHSLIT